MQKATEFMDHIVTKEMQCIRMTKDFLFFLIRTYPLDRVCALFNGNSELKHSRMLTSVRDLKIWLIKKRRSAPLRCANCSTSITQSRTFQAYARLTFNKLHRRSK